MSTTTERNLWRIEFPTAGKVYRLDMAAPTTAESADVITIAYAALSEAGYTVDPFTASAEIIGTH